MAAYTIYRRVARERDTQAGRQADRQLYRDPRLDNTPSNSFSPSSANRTILASRSPPSPVSTSRVTVPLGDATARATYPLFGSSQYRVHIHRRHGQKTYGVRFRVVPPVGPAVPLSQIVYVEPSFCRTFSASPATTGGVGPEYEVMSSWVQPAKATRDSRV